jgi:putative inorganic carbon (hco3(-)) transporter
MTTFFTIFYLIAEYMRPQQMYDSLASLPLGRIAVIGILVGFVVEGRQLVNRNRQNVLIMAYTCWFLISSLFAIDTGIAWETFVDFTKIVLVYFLLINLINDKQKLYLFLIVFLLLNLKWAQWAVKVWASKGFYTDPRGLYEGAGSGIGFFGNMNDMGVALNVALGLSIYMVFADHRRIFSFFRMHWLHVFSSVLFSLAVIATSSRGAAVGLGAMLLGFWVKSRKKIVALGVLAFAALSLIALISDDNWRRFENMGDEEDGTSQSRLELWRAGMEMARDRPLTGVGPNNFITANRRYYNPELTHIQHNIFVQAVSELGYPGLIILLLIIWCHFRNNVGTRALLQKKGIKDPFLSGLSHGLDISMVGFMVNGFFITVLYYPFFWTVLILSTALRGTVEKMEGK